MKSTMKAVLVFLIICISSTSILGDMMGECFMAAFYLELGCTPADLPVVASESSEERNLCPKAFTCPDLHPDPNKCYYRRIKAGHCPLNKHLFTIGDTDIPLCRGCLSDEESAAHVVLECEGVTAQRLEILNHQRSLREACEDPRSILRFWTEGKAYSDRASIPQGEILSLCSQACRCSIKGSPTIDCASVDCVESFDKDIKEQCIDTYEMDSCCTVGVVCGKDEISKLSKCEVDGKVYYEGQRFDLKETGKSCLCGLGWDQDNSTLCRDMNCGLELHYQDDLNNICAPVFYGSGICPIDFQCPSEKTDIIRGLNIRNNEGECKFGNKTLRVGDEIQADDKCTVCKCKIPPFASCQQKNNC